MNGSVQPLPPTSSCARRPAGARCTLCNAGPAASTERYYCPRSVVADLDATLDDGESDPTLVPGYLLRGTLGQGGMGAVYLCESEATGERVAVKRLTNLRSSVHVKRFEREIATLASLKLPGVVQILDHGMHQGTPWFAMEWVQGPSLEEVLAARPLGTAEAVRIVAEVARIVHRVHEQGLVHRDIKPRNIVLTTAGQPVLVDFGLTRHLDDEVHTAHTRRPIGTPAYMAPELLKTTDVDWVRVDVYSLGVVLARSVMGRMPKGEWDLDGVRADLRPALEGSLASQPERRFASAEALATALETTGRPTRMWRWWGLGGVGLVAAAVAGLATCAPSGSTSVGEVQTLLVPWHDRLQDDPEDAQRLFLTLVDEEDPRTVEALWVARAETLETPTAWGDAWAHSGTVHQQSVVRGLAKALRDAGELDALDALLVNRSDVLASDPEHLAALQAEVDAFQLRLDQPFDALGDEHRRQLESMAERHSVGDLALQPTTRRWTCGPTSCWNPDGEVWDVGESFRAVPVEGRLVIWRQGRIDDVELGRGCDVPDDYRSHDGAWWNGRLQLVRSGGAGLHRLNLETCEHTPHPDAEAWKHSYISRTLAWDADNDGVDEQVVLTGAPYDYQVRLYDTDDQLLDVLRIGDAVHGAVWNGDLVVATDRPHGSAVVFGGLQELGAYRIVFEDGELRRVQGFPGHFRAVETADLDGDGHDALYLIDNRFVLWIRETTDSEPLRIGRVSMLEAYDIDGDGSDEVVMERIDGPVVVLGDGGAESVGRPLPGSPELTGDPAVDAAKELQAMGLTSIAASRLAVQALARPRGEAPWNEVAKLQNAADRPDEAIEAWSRMGREGRVEGYQRAVREALRHGDIDAATALTEEWGVVPEELQSALKTRVIDFHHPPTDWQLLAPLATWNADQQLLRLASMGGAHRVAQVDLERSATLAGVQFDLSIDQLEFAADVRIRVEDAQGDGPLIRIHSFGSRHRIGRTITGQKYELGDVLDDDPFGPHRSTVIVALDGAHTMVRVIDEDGQEKRQVLRESLPEGPLRLTVEVRGPPGTMADVALHRMTVWGLDTVPGVPTIERTAAHERAIRNTRLRTSPALETLTADRTELLAAHVEITGNAWSMHRSASRLGRRLVGLPGADEQAVVEAEPTLACLRADAMLSQGDAEAALSLLNRIPEEAEEVCLRRTLLLVAAHGALGQLEEAARAEAAVQRCGVRPATVATARWSLGLDPGDPL